MGAFPAAAPSPFRLFTCGHAGAFLGYTRAFYWRIRRCCRLRAAGNAADRGEEASMADLIAAAMPSDRSLLIVEDDKSFLQRLARAMEGRGFSVTTAESVADGLAQLETASPAFAVVDMRLEDGNGLDVISALKRRRPDARAIILTGYGNIATAVNAVKLGAVDYLSKPVDADDVVAALLAVDGRKAEPPENPMSADRVRWEHIQRIYELCGRNVSETARRLNMHRRTLQRILAKRAPK
jgi:two-component system, response regulator RegA